MYFQNRIYMCLYIDVTLTCVHFFISIMYVSMYVCIMYNVRAGVYASALTGARWRLVID